MINNIKYIFIIAVLSSFVFLSCKMGKEYSKPQMNIPQSFEDKGFEKGNSADIGWSTLYTDSVLQTLIDKALENNKDILIATARIKEMIAKKRIKFSELFPEVGLDAFGQREYLNYGGHDEEFKPKIRGTLTFGWELDVWGKLRWQNDAGVATYMQSVEAQKALHLTIVSQVAQSYFELKALDRELDIVKQTLAARREGVHFAKLRYDGGLTSEIPYRQSLVELARTETLVPGLESEVKLKENDLAVLLGDFPSTMIPRGDSTYMKNQSIKLLVDLPSTILEQRPDIRGAEQKLIEANAQVGVALTDIFPKISLTGRLGGESSEFSDFLQSPTWFLSGLISGPLFNMGKNKAEHKAAQAIFEQEVYSYEKTVLNAFKEVNNALISFRKMKEVRKSQEELYSSAKSYHNLARLQYINGIINYIDVLDAQRQLFDAEIALNDALLNESLSTVSLYKALGGGLIK